MSVVCELPASRGTETGKFPVPTPSAPRPWTLLSVTELSSLMDLRLQNMAKRVCCVSGPTYLLLLRKLLPNEAKSAETPNVEVVTCTEGLARNVL